MIIERFKVSIKKSFSNYPKHKFVIYIVAIIVILSALITISLRKTITINVDDTPNQIITYKSDLNEILIDNNIVIEDKDKISLPLESKISNHECINIKKAVPVYLNFQDKHIQLMTAEDTIQTMLNAESSTLLNNNINYNPNEDEVYPSLDVNIKKDMEIIIVDVDIKNIIEQDQIRFETIIENSDSLYEGEQQIKTNGNNGIKEIQYEVIYKDEVEYSRQIISSTTITAPTNKIIIKGTKKKVAATTISRGMNETPITSIYCVATAYYTGHITASGSTPIRNINGISTIAVDPSVIPMGTQLYVEGYGYAVAADTGGVIKGTKIDLFVNSREEAVNWGIRKVKVNIIKYP